MKHSISGHRKDQQQGTAKPEYPSADLIAESKRLWEPRLGRQLSTDDAKQLIENVAGFFRLLQEWKVVERACQSPDTHKNKDDL